MNNTFWESLQWILSAGGAIGAIVTFFLNKNINQQKHRLAEFNLQMQQNSD